MVTSKQVTNLGAGYSIGWGDLPKYKWVLSSIIYGLVITYFALFMWNWLVTTATSLIPSPSKILLAYTLFSIVHLSSHVIVLTCQEMRMVMLWLEKSMTSSVIAVTQTVIAGLTCPCYINIDDRLILHFLCDETGWSCNLCVMRQVITTQDIEKQQYAPVWGCA